MQLELEFALVVVLHVGGDSYSSVTNSLPVTVVLVSHSDAGSMSGDDFPSSASSVPAQQLQFPMIASHSPPMPKPQDMQPQPT